MSDIDMRATVSYDDGQVRVELLERVGKERFAEIARVTGLRWRRAEQVLSGPWSPELEDVLRDTYGVEIAPEEVDLREVAAGRAGHYQQWSDNAAARRDAAVQTSDDAVAGIPMGQPILVGHHSETRHRRALARSDANMRRALDENKRAEKWDDRAGQTVRLAQRRYTAEVLTRRIRELEAKLRRQLDTEADYAEKLYYHPHRRDLDAGRQRAARWINFLNRRLDRAQLLLEEAEAAAGGDVAESVAARLALPVEVSGGVSTSAPDDGHHDQNWYEVVRINKKSITVRYWLGIAGLEWKLRKEEVKQAMPAAEWARVEKVSYGAGLLIRRVEAEA